ncbi:hypothetical protein ScPMuIL_015514 [Solemya velum]
MGRLEENPNSNHQNYTDLAHESAWSKQTALDIKPEWVKSNHEMKYLPETKIKSTDALEKSLEKSDDESSDVSFLGLYKYADKLDVLLIVVGTITGIGWGAGVPINFYIYGFVAEAFIKNQLYHNLLDSLGSNITNQSILNSTDYMFRQTQLTELEEFRDVYAVVQEYVLYFCLIGIVVFFLSTVSVGCWILTAERQMRRIKSRFFESVMRQSIQWFDTHEGSNLNSRFVEDMHQIADGLGEKIVIFIQYCSTFFVGYIIAFTAGWKIVLVTLPFCPCLMLAGAIVIKFVRNFAQKESAAYACAGSIAEESLLSIRTVAAFNGQEKEYERYSANLHVAKSTAMGKGVVIGLGMGLSWTIAFCIFTVSFWYGLKLFREEDDSIEPGRVLTVFMSIMVGSFTAGQTLPTLEIIGTARGAASKVYRVIETVSKIDSMSAKGLKPPQCRGNIELRNVAFTYPARPECQVLKGMNIHVKVGTTTALVGPSGCGKSTIVQLVQRLYDPEEGTVLFDGMDVKTLNVKWLRDQIGVVSQEPVLFAMSIEENIRYGKLGVSMDEIITAAKEANVHDFISSLPEGYKTVIGERGSQLSGGQKQRVAIARALVRNPKILLLDEATSALDGESEAVVQEALEKASRGRTTIVIAHRLSTIQNADIILGIQDGQVVEEGTHEELLEASGLYAALVKQQLQHFQTVLEELQHEVLEINDDSGTETSILTRQQSSKRSKQVPHRTLSHVIDTQRSLSHTSEKEVPAKGTEVVDTSNASMKRILHLSSPEWPHLLIGCLASIIVGALQPSLAFILGEFLKIFTATVEEQEHLADMMVAIGLGLAVTSAVLRILMSSLLTIAGASLTMRIRQMAFRSIIQQEISYFDKPENQVSALTTRLSNDAALVQKATGNQLANMLEAASTVVSALAVAFTASWKMTLVVLAFLPLVGITGFIRHKLIIGRGKSNKKKHEQAAKLFSEAIDNIQTVMSLTREESFCIKLNTILKEILVTSQRKTVLDSLAIGLGTSILFFGYAGAMIYGSYLVETDGMDFSKAFKVFSAIMFTSMMIAQNALVGSQYFNAKVAASRLLRIIDDKPAIDITDEDGEKPKNFRGAMNFKGIHFHYPVRKEAPVLCGLNLDVEPGQTLALVGASGCGKSTTVQLMGRFYDPDQGVVYADGHKLISLNLKWLREQIGVVSQEPILFNYSIAQNIAYGDNSRDIPMDEIISAARRANIHEFIHSLPEGYETNVGGKGTQLSGGQKQRVAIARALVRNPRVLLLDEATSALDAESEKIVQEALDRAREGRTCVVIAHRLSTIQNADKIAIIHKGEVVELGTHSKLMSKQGIYYRLIQSSQRRT